MIFDDKISFLSSSSPALVETKTQKYTQANFHIFTPNRDTYAIVNEVRRMMFGIYSTRTFDGVLTSQSFVRRRGLAGFPFLRSSFFTQMESMPAIPVCI